jgi:hypothetical protein
MVIIASVVAAATMLKLTTSVDDTVWLAKLYSDESVTHRRYISLVYLLALSLITVASFAVFWCGRGLFEALGSSQHMMAAVSSGLLILFAIFVLRRAEQETVEAPAAARLSQKLKTAFVVSLIGSVDELLTYTVVLSTGEISFIPLLLGTLIAGLLIVLFVNGFTKIRFIRNIVETVPIWVVIATVGTISLAHTLFSGGL